MRHDVIVEGEEAQLQKMLVTNEARCASLMGGASDTAGGNRPHTTYF